MNIVILLLTVVLVLTCLFLCLLVLVQLPKKEAGLGQAFGSGTTDALFGPGSGNMLTTLTKWAAGIFFALTLLVWILHGQAARPKVDDPRTRLSAAERAALTPTAPQNPNAVAASNALGTNLVSTNVGTLLSTGTNTIKAPTNAAPTATTNNAAAPAK